MTDRTQPEALRLAEQYDYGDPLAYSNMWKVAVRNELIRQHARIAELEAELAKARKPCLHQISEPEGEYPPLPMTTAMHASDGVTACWTSDQMHAYVDADRAMRSQAAPASQGDAEDAARYRCIRRGQHWSVIDGTGNELRAEALDTAIDAARKQGANHD